LLSPEKEREDGALQAFCNAKKMQNYLLYFPQCCHPFHVLFSFFFCRCSIVTNDAIAAYLASGEFSVWLRY
jgi:hypothetical protein